MTSVVLSVALAAHAEPENSPPSGRMGHHPHPMPSGMAPAPSGSGPAHGWPGHPNQAGEGDLAEQFRRHRPKPEEAEAKLGELRASFAARRQAHREMLRADFGKGELGHPDLVAELRKHARRMAFLNRAKLVATTDLDEPKRTATLTRIDKLLASEQTRHQTALQKLKTAGAPNSSASAVATAAPAPSGSAP